MSLTITIPETNPFPASRSAAVPEFAGTNDRDLVAIRAVHRALGRCGRALLGALRSLDATDLDEVTQVREWCDRLRPVIAGHHRVIRDIHLPLLVASDPTAARVAPMLQTVQDPVDRHLDRVVAKLDGLEALAAADTSWGSDWQVRAAIGECEAFVHAIDEQVDTEERFVVRPMADLVPAERWDEIRSEVLLHHEPSTLPFLFPWLVQGLDASDEERLVMALPRLLRITHRFVWKPAHERNYPLLVAAGRRADRVDWVPTGPMVA